MPNELTSKLLSQILNRKISFYNGFTNKEGILEPAFIFSQTAGVDDIEALLKAMLLEKEDYESSGLTCKCCGKQKVAFITNQGFEKFKKAIAHIRLENAILTQTADFAFFVYETKNIPSSMKSPFDDDEIQKNNLGFTYRDIAAKCNFDSKLVLGLKAGDDKNSIEIFSRNQGDAALIEKEISAQFQFKNNLSVFDDDYIECSTDNIHTENNIVIIQGNALISLKKLITNYQIDLKFMYDFSQLRGYNKIAPSFFANSIQNLPTAGTATSFKPIS